MERDDVEIIVTAEQLMRWAECADRMTGYADPDGSLLITRLKATDGTPVRLILDRKCCQAARTMLLNSS